MGTTIQDGTGTKLKLKVTNANRALVQAVTITEEDDAIKAMGYTGAKCTECGASMMRQNGACLLCDVCGATSGCS